MKRFFNIAAASLLVAAIQSTAWAEVVVIVSNQSTVTELTKEQVVDIYKGTVKTFPNGQQAIPLDLAKGETSRELFLSKVIERTEDQVRSYWAQQIFTGKGKPPQTMDEEEEMLMNVADNPNMVGYIDSSNVDESVKVVYTAN